MNQTNNTIQFSQFAAVSKDSDEVLGKILYYTLSSILIDREVLARLCDTVDFPYKPIRRSSLADAFRSATGDIYHRLVVKDAGVPQIINVYCRDNRGPKGIISRELVKETLHEDTNEYKKLANISLDRGSGVFSYDNLEADPNVDALSCCQDAQELFALYQTCASRRQIDTLLQNYLDTMQAVKAARGRIYFIPRDYNLCDSYAKSTVGTVLASFDELSGRKDYKGIYLFLSLQYDQLRKPLPDPVWWLMGSPKALKIFSIGFVESLTEVFREEESYVQADDRNAQ